MSQLTTLARPYARAAFETAEKNGALAAWSGMLGLLAALTQHDKVSRYLAAPALSADRQAQTLIDLCGEQLDDKGRNFVRILASHKRLSLLPEILALFETLRAEREKTIDVDVTSAFKMDEAAQAKLAAALKKKLQREVKLHTRVDPALIGGVLVRAGDLVIDGSVRGRLNKLIESMNA